MALEEAEGALAALHGALDALDPLVAKLRGQSVDALGAEVRSPCFLLSFLFLLE